MMSSMSLTLMNPSWSSTVSVDNNLKYEEWENFRVFLTRSLSLISILDANTNFNCSTNCFNSCWSIFAIAVLFLITPYLGNPIIFSNDPKSWRLWIFFLMSALRLFFLSFLFSFIRQSIQKRFEKSGPSF